MYCLECYSENPEGSLFCESCGCPFEVKAKKEEKKLLKDRYKVISSLSAGGVGGVSLGYDVRLNRACAIKGIYKKGLDDLPPEERETIVKPFKREAELLANLRHPNLPCVTDYFIENDVCYLVMDYIEGKDLEIILEEEGGKPLLEKQVMEWGIQICRVLEYLHNQKPPIIHGDLKLANLIIRDSDGWIMLVDFGTASLETLASEEENPYGTDGYAPPEQYLGAQEIRSDIYSLGVTIYELLTLSLPEEPFKFAPVRELEPQVSVDMERIVMKCVEYDMEDRFETATVLKQNLLAAYKRNFGMTRSRYRTGKLMVKDRRISSSGLKSETETIKVFVVDNDVDMCNSFQEIAKFFKGIEVIGAAHNGKEAVDKIRKSKIKPHVILMEIRMPVMNGIDATREIRDMLPFSKIVILSAFLEEDEFLACFDAGASGYILKGDTSWEELEKSIKKAYEGGTPISSDASTFLIKALTSQKISPPKEAPKVTFKKSRPKEDVDEEMKLCPSCNRLNRPKAKYCKECGENIDEFAKIESEDGYEEGEDVEYEEEVIEEIVLVEGEEGDDGDEEIVEEIIVVEEDEEEKIDTEQKDTPVFKEDLIEEKAEEVSSEEEPLLIIGDNLEEEEPVLIIGDNFEEEEPVLIIGDNLEEEEPVLIIGDNLEEEPSEELDEQSLNKMNDFLELGKKYLAEEDLESALIYFKEAWKFNEREPLINYDLAGIYHSREEADKAMYHYKLAVEEQPDFLEGHTGLGQLYLEQDALEDAAIHFNKALELNPKSGDAYLKLGYIKQKEGEIDAALNYFAYVIELVGDNTEAYLGLGNVYQVQKDFYNAIRYYTSAIELDDRCIEAYSNLGIIYTKQKKYELALSNLRRAISISFEPSFIELYDDCIEKLRADKKEWESPYKEEDLRSFLLDIIKNKENIPLLENIAKSWNDNLKSIEEFRADTSKDDDEMDLCANCGGLNRYCSNYCRDCGADFISQEEIAEGIVNEVIQVVLEEEADGLFNKKPVKIGELIKTAEDMTHNLSIVKYLPEKETSEEEEVYTLCPNCEMLNRFGARYCRDCGVEFEYEDIEEVENFVQDLPLALEDSTDIKNKEELLGDITIGKELVKKESSLEAEKENSFSETKSREEDKTIISDNDVSDIKNTGKKKKKKKKKKKRRR